MNVNKRLAGTFLLVGLLLGGLVAGISLNSKPGSVAASQTDQCVDDDATEAADAAVESTEDLDNVPEEVECGPQDDNEDDDRNEAGDGPEGADVPITGSALEQASAAALEYIGEGRVTETEVGDEEGYYEVEITKDNGREVDVHLDENFNILGHEDD